MGIPSYFSYIVKNHAEIIRRYSKTENTLNVSNFYLDCNSIIYDSYSKLNPNILTENIGLQIIQSVIDKINEYISIINPSKNVIIAFDGVAPIAKLKQQRERRYKSYVQQNYLNNHNNNSTQILWDRTAITPGTTFMRELNEHVNEYYKNIYNSKNINNDLNIIISGSNEVGEGEHKIFDFIRNNPEKHFEQNTFIYGLDSDLIMLSMNHLYCCPNIYLFRETPEFIKSIDKDLEPNENYLLDIKELSTNISYYMTTNESDININRSHDYILLCFLLGNDFMPHFPALNIRKEGINKILDAYKNTIGCKNELLYDENLKKINWINFKKIIGYLAEKEHGWMMNEHASRDKIEKQFTREMDNYDTTHHLPQTQMDEKKINLIPIYNRQIEKHINPFNDKWQNRYYKNLFKNPYNKRDIAINYLECLEWTMKYYTTYQIDWNFKYEHNYPPLLEDLYKYIPDNNTHEFITNINTCQINELTQLCYVLPGNSLNLLPKKISKKILNEFPNWYHAQQTFVWSYCRYFWEAHLVTEHLNMEHFIDVINEK